MAVSNGFFIRAETNFFEIDAIGYQSVQDYPQCLTCCYKHVPLEIMINDHGQMVSASGVAVSAWVDEWV